MALKSAKGLAAPAWVAKQVILASQYTPFRGRGGYGCLSETRSQRRAPFAEAVVEAARVEDFFQFFGTIDARAALVEKHVLDFGSGYGGRTVEYARRYQARFVWGVEPFESVVAESSRYSQSHGIPNVEFLRCGHKSIPLGDKSVDVVLSYDVLEHVADPRTSMREIYRVLRPGGVAFLVFPAYLGALSHHLDYITLVPGLHWCFAPATLVAAVNDILANGGSERFGTSQQPEPGLGFDLKRSVLPTLNGLGGEHLAEVLGEFEILQLHRHGWVRRRRPRSAAMRVLSSLPLPVRVLDACTSSISCVLRKSATAVK